jgi:hypothetical protein
VTQRVGGVARTACIPKRDPATVHPIRWSSSRHMMCPYLARQLSGFSTAGSKFISIVRRARMVSTGDNRIYNGLGL